MGNLHVQMEDSSSAIWPTTPEVFSAQRIIATATGPCCEMYLIPVGRETAGNHELQTLGQIAHGIIWNNMEQHGIIPVEENWIQLTCFDNHAEDLSVLVRMPRGYNPLTAAFFGTNVSEKERLNEGPRNVNLALAFWWWRWGGAGVGLQRRHKKTRYITHV